MPIALTSVLAVDEWSARAAAHEARIERWTVPYRERRRRGETHPVHDFLFTYYSETPGRLRRWHPGPGVVLAGPAHLGCDSSNGLWSQLLDGRE